MPAAATPSLTPGRVYRTADFRRYGKNPARLAQRLVAEGRLAPLARGLYVRPEQSKWGVVPPDDRAVLRALLGGSPFLMTGPPQWNALGLGATAVFPVALVYNHKRTGEFVIGNRRYLLRRVAFPRAPRPEYFAIDLLRHHDMAGIPIDTVAGALVPAIQAKRLRPTELRAMATRYGTARIVSLIEHAIRSAATTV